VADLAIKGGAPVVPPGMIQPWPQITAEDKRAVMAALESASPWRHPFEEARALEQEWAAFVGARYALACNTGTASLHMSVAACEIGPGDEVLVPADTYLASASCVLHCNGIPIFLDVRPETDTLDPARIEERITDRTRAIMAVNLHGLPADYDEIHAIAAKHGLLVMEDGAQSHGATYKGRRAGALGHASGCSLNGSKPLSALGEGGLFTTDDERRCALAQHLRTFGEIVDPPTPREYDAYMMGYTYRADPLQAAFARSQLRRLPEMTEVRLQNGAHLTRRLAEIPGIQPPYVPPDRTHTYFQYTMQLRPEELGLDASALGAFHTTLCTLMRAEGVPLRAWQRHPVPAQALFQQQVGYGKGCPWSCSHTRPGIRYDPLEYPVAADICRRRVMLGHSTDSFGPPNGIELMECYAEAFHKVLVEHREELIDLVDGSG
jgi:dTDP-4-amino-4,6-dideoxygalactose transaminase